MSSTDQQTGEEPEQTKKRRKAATLERNEMPDYTKDSELRAFYCGVHRCRLSQPHLQCPNRIEKALSLYPKCVLCNLQGSQVEGMRRRLGWTKRYMAQRLNVPWATYADFSTGRRTGKTTGFYDRVKVLINEVMENPGDHINEEIRKEIAKSPMDFFNRYIGEFPWQDKDQWQGKPWPDPVWVEPGEVGEPPDEPSEAVELEMEQFEQAEGQERKKAA